MTSMNLVDYQENELLFIGFNQDFGCFACGTDTGFRIYNVHPFKETFRRVFTSGSIGIVEMLFRCNLLALVGGGRNPRYPPNKVMIWDDHQNRCIGELSFRNEVRAVKLRRDRVVVCLESKIFVYRFSDLKILDQISTLPNKRGIIALSPDPQHTVLACPGIAKGHVRVELYDIGKSTLIPAHESELCQLALNYDGTHLATASDKGTLIRVFNTKTGALIRELRRGMDRAEIYSLVFNVDATYLACSSDKGTVHIFKVKHKDYNQLLLKATATTTGTNTGGGTTNTAASSATTNKGNPDGTTVGGGGGSSSSSSGGGGSGGGNTRSGLSFVRGMLPASLVPRYLESEWSFAQVHGLEGRTVCAFVDTTRTGSGRSSGTSGSGTGAAAGTGVGGGPAFDAAGTPFSEYVAVVSSNGTYLLCSFEGAVLQPGSGTDPLLNTNATNSSNTGGGSSGGSSGGGRSAGGGRGAGGECRRVSHAKFARSAEEEEVDVLLWEREAQLAMGAAGKGAAAASVGGNSGSQPSSTNANNTNNDNSSNGGAGSAGGAQVPPPQAVGAVPPPPPSEAAGGGGGGDPSSIDNAV